MADELKDVNHILPLPDFVKGGLDYLPSGAFEQAVNTMRVIEIFLGRYEDIDKGMVNLAQGRTILNAEGRILDEIGEQHGIFRNGLNDPEYRAVIIILTGNNAKSGTRGEIISTLFQIFGEDGVSTYKGNNFRIDINVYNTCVELSMIIPQILEMLPLPTHLRVVESNGYPFAFSGDNQSFGFSSVFDEDRTTGPGGFASLIYVSDDESPWA